MACYIFKPESMWLWFVVDIKIELMWIIHIACKK